MSDISLTLIIPCYNEYKNLEILTRKCVNLCETHPEISILLVDNGSTDESPAFFENNTSHERVKNIRVDENHGYGYGILAGLQAADGDILGWTHGDLQADPKDVSEALSTFKEAKDVKNLFVKGRRVGRPFRDMVFTHGMTVVSSVVLGESLKDINGQPTLFHRSFIESWEKPPTDFSLDLFVYSLALKRGMAIERVTVDFNQRMFGEGHNDKISSKLKYSQRTVKYIFALRERFRNS